MMDTRRRFISKTNNNLNVLSVENIKFRITVKVCQCVLFPRILSVLPVGTAVGEAVVGVAVGELVGFRVGVSVGLFDGFPWVGSSVGDAVGAAVGLEDGRG